jgi:hypothetical protein
MLATVMVIVQLLYVQRTAERDRLGRPGSFDPELDESVDGVPLAATAR